MTLFGLVRHGQTDYNLHGLFQGSSDIPLNATGREQAHHALDTAAPIAWDGAVSSPLQRARQTARIIAEDHDIPLLGTDPRLSEIDWGEAEGKDVVEMETRYPDRSFPGREGLQQVADRGYLALDDLAADHPGRSLLVVAHGTFIRLLLSGVIGTHLPSIPNGTLSLLRLEGEQWRVEMIAGESIEEPARTATTGASPRFPLAEHHLRPFGL
ncbi:histidine phosphatase family protein [Brachybacterium endophyticum]|uniref:Histidine phosphatase family protein n=1 Tax=Brachybacterium endophyticum TaxID=2182385 RepID=A0A2U2RHD6_9MICO|nr:histidine phosphatase family protein [Brachybacterium endophyticum]PWH05264.1 histidine phosphatase family protein [Brachybacterium endophyticum]